MRLELPKRTPSLNQWQRWHWAQRAREKRDWSLLVLAAVLDARKRGDDIGRAESKRIVRVVRHSTHLLDPDNLGASCKPLLDALKNHGLIVDDSPRWLSLEVSQERSSRCVTIVEIKDTETDKHRGTG